ncbi:MAG TPA: hypothetical protein VFN92_04175 [Solirubrobacterales bacterium]|nr:hypothetical protein [Solirubrobacterales bacterium]
MSLKKNLATALLAVLALGVSTSQALAATPEGDPEGGTFPVAATATSGASVLSVASGLTVSCTSGTGTGQATSKTTGEGSYTLHGCKESIFGTTCTTAGQPAGTIKLATMTMHLVYLDHSKKPGVLATPPAGGLFAKVTCGAGLVVVEVTGNGVLGEILTPKCGEVSKTSTVKTETVSHGTQLYRQVEGTGTMYDLTVSINGGALQTAGTTWLVTGTSAKSGTLTCP